MKARVFIFVQFKTKDSVYTERAGRRTNKLTLGKVFDVACLFDTREGVNTGACNRV